MLQKKRLHYNTYIDPCTKIVRFIVCKGLNTITLFQNAEIKDRTRKSDLNSEDKVQRIAVKVGGCSSNSASLAEETS